MYVTDHAWARIRERTGAGYADECATRLERVVGGEGVVAYVLDTTVSGDLLVAVAVDGSVETVYFRRASQDMSPAFFGARAVRDLRPEFDLDPGEPEPEPWSTEERDDPDGIGADLGGDE
jgi:hypothetical protein